MNDPETATEAVAAAEAARQRFERHRAEQAERERRQEKARKEREEDLATAARIEQEARAAEFESRTERQPHVCRDCRGQFEALVFFIGTIPSFRQNICPPCFDARQQRAEAEHAAARTAARREAWLDMCPEDYLETDTARCERELAASGVSCTFRAGAEAGTVTISHSEFVAKVLSWPLEGVGLAIVGETGRCKTRLLFKLLETYHMAGVEVGYVNAASMSDTIGALYSRGAAHGDGYVHRLETVAVLLIDDLGKGKLTERAEQSLYRITEARKAHKRKTFFTANCTGAELIAGMSIDRGQPIVRRLREMTASIGLIEKAKVNA